MLTNTSIHAALGEAGPLDFSTIERAVERGVREDETLDWKGSEYRQVSDQDPGDEFAKDVAALANTRGGILVLGVSEERRTGRASRLTPITITDALERRMRAWLNTRVSPRIEGIRFVPLLRDAAAEEGVLVISIPASPDMPHMIGEKKSCGFPYRYGTQTLWMREFDLERAYRDRFERRAADEAVLARSIRDASDYLGTEGQCWVVAAARPTTPLPTRVQAPSREQVQQVMADAEAAYRALMPEGFRRANLISALGDRVYNPRVGMHRWVMSETSNPGDPSALADGVHVELLHDGSVIVAVLADGREQERIEGKNTVPDAAVAGLVVGFVNLLDAVARHRGVEGAVVVRVDLVRGDQRPYGFLMPRREGPFTFGLEQPSWSRDVRNFQPVETVVPPMPDLEARRQTALGLVTDMAAQFGVTPDQFGFEWND
ncbi:helix-turn-helix domain-containing protein [Geodermatophilus sp. SYSU D01186]